MPMCLYLNYNISDAGLQEVGVHRLHGQPHMLGHLRMLLAGQEISHFLLAVGIHQARAQQRKSCRIGFNPIGASVPVQVPESGRDSFGIVRASVEKKVEQDGLSRCEGPQIQRSLGEAAGNCSP